MTESDPDEYDPDELPDLDAAERERGRAIARWALERAVTQAVAPATLAAIWDRLPKPNAETARIQAIVAAVVRQADAAERDGIGRHLDIACGQARAILYRPPGPLAATLEAFRESVEWIAGQIRTR